MKNFLIITGASRGIGKETAQLFLDAEWTVINLSRSPCGLPDIINISTDLSHSDWFKLVEPELLRFLSKPSKISIVHNAALLNAKDKTDSIFDLSQASFYNILAVNLLAPIKLNQLLLPYMLPGSSIIYMGSVLSEKAIKNAASYVISKHALVGLMRSTCQDLAGTGIYTTCICPGFTDTEMLRQHLHHDQNVLESVKNRVGAKRLIKPMEIAELIWFCANHEVINGSVLGAHLGQIET